MAMADSRSSVSTRLSRRGPEALPGQRTEQGLGDELLPGRARAKTRTDGGVRVEPISMAIHHATSRDHLGTADINAKKCLARIWGLCHVEESRGVRSSAHSTHAVAAVGGLRCVDHPDDLELDARRQRVEHPSTTTEWNGRFYGFSRRDLRILTSASGPSATHSSRTRRIVCPRPVAQRWRFSPLATKA